jgi:hypothetical protein
VANAPGSTDGLNVSAYLASGSQTLDSLFLGQVNLGERVTLNLVWDQPNHRFITRLFRPASNTLVERYMPYTVSDAMPPASPQRALSARAQPVNCLGRRTVADMDVLFDNVMTN